MDREAWWATVYGVAKSQTRLSDFTFFHFNLNYFLKGPISKYMHAESQAFSI